MNDLDDTDQPCPHGDYRSCVVDDCRPLQRTHVPGVLVPPPSRVACMWCGGDSDRGQCPPCAALLDAIHAAPSAGIDAIVAAIRAQEGSLDLHVRLTTDEVDALKAVFVYVRVQMAHDHPWTVRDAAMTGLGKVLTAAAGNTLAAEMCKPGRPDGPPVYCRHNVQCPGTSR